MYCLEHFVTFIKMIKNKLKVIKYYIKMIENYF